MDGQGVWRERKVVALSRTAASNAVAVFGGASMLVVAVGCGGGCVATSAAATRDRTGLLNAEQSLAPKSMGPRSRAGPIG